MKIFLFLIEAGILGFMIFINIQMFKEAKFQGDEDKMWRWVILLCTFALTYFVLNALYQLIFS